MAAKEPDSLLLVDAHRPPLTPGTYHVSIDQNLSNIDTGSRLDSFNGAARFHVLGPRLALEPGWIATRFPTPHSTGDHANVMPHVSLTRSTLPWERNADATGDPEDPVPWLAALLFTEAELTADGGLPAAVLHEIDAGSLFTPSGRPTSTLPAFPGLDKEKGSVDDDRVRVLDVPRGRLEPVLPDGDWLASLTHVKEHFVGQVSPTAEDLTALDREELTDGLRSMLRRHNCPLSSQANVATESIGAEWTVSDRETGHTYYLEYDAGSQLLDVANEAKAAIVSCRATTAGTAYQAFLVSLEGRYRTSGSNLAFDFGAASQPTDLIRLVVLDTWTFAVEGNAGLLERLLLGLVYESLPPPADEHATKNLTLTIPIDAKSGPGLDALSGGYALLPHRLRHGGHTRSWYRGPLLPRPRPAGFEGLPALAVTDSDQLLILDNLYQMFDCSYAAAWELGRHLALSNREIALDLTAWESARRRWSHQQPTGFDRFFGESSPSRDHLPLGHSSEPPPLPSSVGDFAERLTTLDGVPFNYLVPDPAMLPPESLKTFVVDHWWTYCLFDGMLSLGRLHGRNDDTEVSSFMALHQRAYRHLSSDQAPEGQPNTVAGVLIRSQVVSGWPDLHIEIYHPDSGDILPPLRRVKLSDNVLLILVEGPIGRIRAHPNMEAIHHGIEPAASVSNPTPMRSGEVVDVSALVKPSPSAVPRTPSQVARLLMASGRPMLDIHLT